MGWRWTIYHISIIHLYGFVKQAPNIVFLIISTFQFPRKYKVIYIKKISQRETLTDNNGREHNYNYVHFFLF